MKDKKEAIDIEFMPTSVGAVIDAYDQNNNFVPDLLTISNDYWYYDVNEGNLYYDEDADQFMEDAVLISKVTNSSNNLTITSFHASDLEYTS